ncbi:hypothetical protein Scep_028245 [Stephania cephalantha]|uniref:Uncharacterized protein n=1 Tax=Stephania cephalantha TaxID=152367 RepID=A0AAP0EDD8_9MAGN
MTWCDDVTPARLDGGVVREEKKKKKGKKRQEWNIKKRRGRMIKQEGLIAQEH